MTGKTTSMPFAPLDLLRRELPALGLTIGFAPKSRRDTLAVFLLLWLELRRATLASEVILTATRLAWWRDALETGRTEGVPMADYFVEHGLAEPVAAGIGIMVEGTMEQGRPISPHGLIAALLADVTACDVMVIEDILKGLDQALKGKGGKDKTGEAGIRSGHPSLDLIAWCCQKPSRLDYPEKHPLLAVQMMLAAIRL